MKKPNLPFEIRKFAVNNPHWNNYEISVKFAVTPEFVQEILNTKINVVRSSYNEKMFFVFNEIAERRLFVDSENVIQNRHDFHTVEINILRNYGFKIS